ncbi:kelch repeat-containing protein [Pyruvatibacter sp.]|uniref:Kelch repeat-containing protein n=1 Tax=Pyruvatibacter sp. TaxID=1981328 RepID=UPI003264143E
MVAALTKVRSAFLGSVLFGAMFTVAPAMAGSWSEGAPIGEARAFGAAAAQGETIYVAGGAGLKEPVADFAAYDVLGDIWRPLPTMPIGRQGFGMATALDGGVYVAGGYAGEDFDTPSSELWRYDMANAVWVRMADMPAGRARHGMASLDGKLYVVGGEGPNASRVFVYDTFQAAWSELGADLPAPRKDLGVVAAAGNIYALGGRTGNGVTAQVHVLDVEATRWRQGSALPSPRADAAVGVVAGQIHLAGGRSNDPMRTFSEHYVLDASGGGWRKAEPLPLPRLGAASAGSGGAFVIVGGSGGAGVFSLFTTSDVVDIYKP